MTNAFVKILTPGDILYTQIEGISHEVDGREYIDPFQVCSPFLNGEGEHASNASELSEEVMLMASGSPIQKVEDKNWVVLNTRLAADY